jgi:hypothetical protein
MSLTRDEQKQLAQQLADELSRYLIVRIENEKIPAHWDGNELRQLIADLAKDNASYVFNRGADRKRKKDYKNTRMIEGF